MSKLTNSLTDAVCYEARERDCDCVEEPLME